MRQSVTEFGGRHHDEIERNADRRIAGKIGTTLNAANVGVSNDEQIEVTTRSDGARRQRPKHIHGTYVFASAANGDEPLQCFIKPPAARFASLSVRLHRKGFLGCLASYRLLQLSPPERRFSGFDAGTSCVNSSRANILERSRSKASSRRTEASMTNAPR